MKRGLFVSFLFLIVFLGVSFFFLYSFKSSPTGLAIFSQSGTEFNLGTYSNTEYNSTNNSIQLSSGQTLGLYTSRVFDAGNDANWNNLIWVGNQPDTEFLFAVDGSGSVFKSNNLGIVWAKTTENYGRTLDTIDMFADSSYLYIISNTNREVWKSGNLGTSFIVVNNNFADSNLLLGQKDLSENLLVVDASGDVYLSNNYGASWTLRGDFNGAATNNGKGIAINSNGVFIVDGSGSVFKSTDSGVSWTLQSGGYGGGPGTDGMVSDSSGNLYILLNKAVYKSTDDGVNWNVISNPFTLYEQEGLKIAADSSDNLYILDSQGKVWKSTNSGVSWTEVGDFNSEATNNPKGFTNFIKQTNLSFQVRNCSQSDCSDASWQDVDLNNINLQSRYFQYKVSFSSPDTSATPILESVNIDYTIISTAPTLNLIKPQEGTTYGYNKSLPIEFSVYDADENLQACWYNLDSGTNIAISECQNTTFNVSEGSHILTIFANDSLGLIASSSVAFSVNIGAPTILLNSPINTYLPSEQVTFTYTTIDIDLDSCELWGNWTGWHLNQSKYLGLANSGIPNFFLLNLSEGNYQWNIKCNNSFSRSSMNGNKSFSVDYTSPSVDLTQPSGSYSSKTSIPIAFTIIDTTNVKCFYNLSYQSSGSLIKANTEIANCSSTSFDVDLDSSYVFWFFANDSADNTAYINKNFTVSASSGGGILPGGGGSSSSSGVIKNFEIQETSLLANPGETKKLAIKTKNLRSNFLNNCKIKSNSSWIFSSAVKDLNAGESYDFIIDLNVPKQMAPGAYNLSLILTCEEASQQFRIIMEVIERKLELKLIEATKFENSLEINYSLKDFSGKDQEVEVEIILFEDRDRIAELKEKRKLSANKEENFKTFLIINETLKGTFNLVINANSPMASAFVQEEIIVGKTSIGGLAVYLRENTADSIALIFLAGVFGIFAFFIIRRILQTRRLTRN